MIQIGDLRFDDVDYDARGDVLYLSIGPPRPAADIFTSPEGHAVHYDDRRRVIAITLISAHAILERESELAVTVAGERLVADQAAVEQTIVSASPARD